MNTPSLTLSQAVKSVIKENYCNFTGRARRSEYWNFVLFIVILSFIFSFVTLILVPFFGNSFITFIPMIFFYVFLFYCFIPGLAVIVRRLHDTGRSGLYYFVGLIPFIGEIILIIFLLEDSQPNTNMLIILQILFLLKEIMFLLKVILLFKVILSILKTMFKEMLFLDKEILLFLGKEILLFLLEILIILHKSIMLITKILMFK